jgi:hypothetical protein
MHGMAAQQQMAISQYHEYLSQQFKSIFNVNTKQHEESKKRKKLLLLGR